MRKRNNHPPLLQLGRKGRKGNNLKTIRMKTKIREHENGLNIEIEPETPEETAQLLRFSNNARAEKPSINMYFSSLPICTIWMRKVSSEKQINHISNK